MEQLERRIPQLKKKLQVAIVASNICLLQLPVFINSFFHIKSSLDKTSVSVGSGSHKKSIAACRSMTISA